MHHCKYNLTQLDVDVNKYVFEVHQYFLPPLVNLDEYLLRKTSSSSIKSNLRIGLPSNGLEESIEPFKINQIFTNPCKCSWEFMTEDDILKIRNEKKLSKLKKIIDGILCRVQMQGLPRKLLIDLFVSVIKFSLKLEFDNIQICSLLAIFYNTHLYFTHNLWVSAEDIYKCFKDFLYFNCINLQPLRRKVFELHQCKPIAMYFSHIYLKYLPLIRMLMLPNYALLFKTTLPIEFQETVKKRDKKEKKGKSKKKK